MIAYKINNEKVEISLVLRLLPRKTGRETGRFDHVPHDVACIALCTVLVIEILPSIVSLLPEFWMLLETYRSTVSSFMG